MKTIQLVFWAHLFTAVAALAAAYTVAGLWLVALIFLLLGGLWFLGQQHGAGSIGGLLLFVFLLAAGLCSWLGAPPALLVIAAAATLGAWDLDAFLQRLRAAARVDFESGLGSHHLRRLALIEGVGVAVGMLALLIRAGIPFWWEALLALLAVAGISGMIRFMRGQVED